jgi:hypothetical protein
MHHGNGKRSGGVPHACHPVAFCSAVLLSDLVASAPLHTDHGEAKLDILDASFISRNPRFDTEALALLNTV